MSRVLRTTEVHDAGAAVDGAGGVVLATASGIAHVGVAPDPEAARAACALARRVQRVTLVDGADGWSATVTAVWHRLPRTRPIATGAAVALALAGVPAYVHDGSTS